MIHDRGLFRASPPFIPTLLRGSPYQSQKNIKPKINYILKGYNESKNTIGWFNILSWYLLIKGRTEEALNPLDREYDMKRNEPNHINHIIALASSKQTGKALRLLEEPKQSGKSRYRIGHLILEESSCNLDEIRNNITNIKILRTWTKEATSINRSQTRYS